MKKTNILLLSILFSCSVFSQAINDTIFLKNGNRVIGSIYQIYGSSVVKIKTPKGNDYSFKESSINRLGYGYKKELETQIILSKGDTINGIILERKIDAFLKIKTPENTILNLLDSNILSVKQTSFNSPNIYQLYLKNQNTFWGSIENQNQFNLMIIRNIWTNQMIRIDIKDVLKIDTISTYINTQQKIVHLNSGLKMVGYLNDSTQNSIYLHTKKYGDYQINKKDIIQMIDSIETNKIDTAKIETNKKPKTEIKLKSVLSGIINGINIYNLNALASFGLVSSNTLYYMPQLGINIQFANFNKFDLSSELRVGLSTNFNNANTSISLSPMILGYKILKNLNLELIPDLHIRIFDAGSRTTIGLLVGGKYNLIPKLALNLRLGYSGGLYVGIAGQYNLKTNK